MKNLLDKLDDFKREYAEKNIIVFTSDVDWASEAVILKELNYFIENEVPITFFLTHRSELLDASLHAGKIKCNIHPNFMHGSSQGENFDQVIDFCFSLLPSAKGFRAHRYFDVNDTIDKLYLRGIRYESNICTHLDIVPPFLHRSGMIGFPIFMEDGGYLFQRGDLNYKSIKERIHKPGLKIINIHPMHFAINTPYFAYTREIKDRLKREEYINLSEDSIYKLRYEGNGITCMIKTMVEDILDSNIETAYLEDVYEAIINR